MNKILNPSKADWPEILKRPTQTVADIEQTVNQIFDEIRLKGNVAVAKYTELFDGIKLEDLKISESEVSEAEKQISEELKSAIKLAKANIEKFHAAQKTGKVSVETASGVNCWQQKKAIQKVGLYIPGGTAPLFSSILMLAIPASIAGCKEIVLCTPPDESGNINPAIVYTASLCGVTQIFKIGGIWRKMPITYANFWVGSLAIIGIFPLAGFYSKDLILEFTYSRYIIDANFIYFIGVVSAMFTVIYSVRLIFFVFEKNSHYNIFSIYYIRLSSLTHECSIFMFIPMFILCFCSIFIGYLFNNFPILGLLCI